MVHLKKELRLEQVCQDFNDWREHKSYSREPIPDHLWAAAVDLIDDYSVNQISKILRLDCKKLNTIVNNRRQKQIVPSNVNMVELTDRAVNQSIGSKDIVKIKIQRPDGALCRVDISAYNMDSVCAVVNQFVGRS